MPESRVNGARPLADPLQESKRLVDSASRDGVTLRLLGGVAVCLQAPEGTPLLPRKIGDIDVATKRDGKRAATGVLTKAGYEPDEHFNAFHGAQRLLFYDQVNGRKLDVFVGSFAMCHAIPIADRLDLEPFTVPLAELMLTKLQVVALTERDQRDIYNLAYHHEMSEGDSRGIEVDYIASICAKDWGLWRTSKTTVERCLTNLSSYELSPDASATITERIKALWKRIDDAPKSTRWRLRNQVGDRVRWYEEPEENTAVN